MSTQERILSVDFLRGLTVAMMILVNNPGSWEDVFAPLLHASWHGCTPTDLVFPTFLFIVGISIVYALGSAKNDPTRHRAAIQKIIKRGFTLFMLGFALNILGNNFDFSTVRIPGVLQRIAIVFIVSAILFIKADEKNIIRIGVLILITYWLLMAFVPVPGMGPASFESGKNLGAWVDQIILGDHVWTYSKPWDPEGLLSSLPAIVNGLLGVLTGMYLRKPAEPMEKVTHLFIAATALTLGGMVWDLFFPINKSIWTSSFVLYTTGITMHGLAFSYWLIDVRKFGKGLTPFLAFGSNAMAAYMLSELLGLIMYKIPVTLGPGNVSNLKSWYFQVLNTGFLPPQFLSLCLAILWVFMIFIPILILYRKKIYIKV